MSDATILGVLTLVLTSVGGAGMWILRSLLTDVLSTNRALREALVSMGQRMALHMADDQVTSNMIEDIHRELLGPKRTSDYGEARAMARGNGQKG